MMNLPLPTQAYLRECLMYFPVSGRLFWRHRSQHHFNSYRAFITWNAQHALHEAFATPDKDGYRTGRLNGRTYKAHRIIFKLLHNSEPPRVDHEDGNVQNNTAGNLKASSDLENLKNKRLYSSNTSGAVGVSFKKQSGKWCAHIRVAGKRRHLGYFNSIDEAIAVRKAAAIELGFSSRHGEAA